VRRIATYYPTRKLAEGGSPRRLKLIIKIMETTLINKSNFKGLTVSLSKEFKVAASEKGSGFSYHWVSLNGTPYLGGKAFEAALASTRMDIIHSSR
jgi:hypothetical protein